jgi:glucose/arabinose dehydrogenase
MQYLLKNILLITLLSLHASAETKCVTPEWQPVFPALPNLEKITGLVQAPNDNTYWYATHQPGKLFRFKNDTNTNKLEEVLNIKDRVDDSSNEMGLLGIVFHPTPATHPYVYLNYTGRTAKNEKETRISRFDFSKNGMVNAKSELILLRFNQPYANHNGGDLAFGADGYLYISSGDGGSGGDPHENGQNTQNLLGKILRIDVNKTNAGKNYAIPIDNPFVAGGGAPEIYAYGLRNPWRISFDKKTNQLWVADVGQNSWEEVNIVERGGNYGWGDMEGESCFADRKKCSTTNKILPILSINHSTGACSITGGYVYRGSQYPEAQGKYFFTDYCANTLQSITRNNDGSIKPNQHGKLPEYVVTFAQSNQGELYAVGQSGAGKQIVGMVKDKCSEK